MCLMLEVYAIISVGAENEKKQTQDKFIKTTVKLWAIMEINITCRGQRIKILSRMGKRENYRFQGTGVGKQGKPPK